MILLTKYRVLETLGYYKYICLYFTISERVRDLEMIMIPSHSEEPQDQQKAATPGSINILLDPPLIANKAQDIYRPGDEL